MILRSKFWDNFDHLVDIDKLDPAVQLFCRIIEDEPRVVGAPEKRDDTFILLVDELITSSHAERRSPYAKLPPRQGVAIAHCSTLWDVELEARIVKANRVSDRFDVGLFQCEDYAEPAKNGLVVLLLCNICHL